LRVELTDVHRTDDLLDVTVRYWAGNELWTQTFTARRMTEDVLQSELTTAGLTFGGYLTDDHAWFAPYPSR
jgi:hypothetical protein